MRVTLIVLVLALASAQNVSGSGGQQQQGKSGCGLRCRRLTFVGEGSVPIKPDWALVQLSVEVSSQQLQGRSGADISGGSNTGSGSGSNASGSGGQSAEMQAAMKVRDEAKHRSQFILNYLKDLKNEEFKDLQMQEISFRPDFDEDDGERKFLGYLATFGLSFKVKLNKLQEVLDQIVSESGANRVDNIALIADEETLKKANIQAIEQATSNAWQQAQAVSKVFGIPGNLKLLSVREGLLPRKRLIRRMARRFRRLARRFDRDDDNRMGEGMRGGMDNDFGDIGNWEQGEQIINALLTFQFDFEDGTINFKEVAPVMNNFTMAESLEPLFSGGNQTKPDETKKPQEATPTVTNTTIILPNNTASMNPSPTGTAAVVQPTQPVATQPVATTAPPP